MSKRVHELADELGINKQELVSRINGLGLGLSVANYMSVLSPDEVESIKAAVNAKPAEPKVDQRVAPTVIRRRSKKKADAEKAAKSGDSSDDEAVKAVAPIRRRRKVGEDDDAEDTPTPPEEVAEAPEEEPEAAEEEAEEVAEVEAEAAEADESAEEEPEEVADEVAETDEAPEADEATDTDEDVEDEAEEAPQTAEADDAADAEESAAEVEEEAAADAEEESIEGDAEESAAAEAPKQVAQARTPERPARGKDKGGAKVLGAINQSVLLDRLAAEGKDFSPGPKRTTRSSSDRRSGRRGKRVVEGRDLYDSKSRRSKQRRQQQNKRPQKTQITEAAEHKRVIRVEDAITVGDLAHQMGIKAGQVAMTLLESGMMATVNTTIDFETAAIIAEEFGYSVENVAFDISDFYDTEPDADETLQTRPPVVTVMGHVDHGKTSLLDAIRSAEVAEGEAGGITQHIGAYQVKTDSGMITFLDTPGHEAFTALRARGAQATDLTVLVVAADDGVMPQTMEAINHSQDAGVPIIVAINKVDKPSANPERVKQALTEYELIPEEWGGKTLFVEVSALERTNITGLIEAIMLQAELAELRANPERDAQGLVIEAELDVGRGPVATVLVQRGSLHKGDIIVSGRYYGRVRTMIDDRGDEVETARPSQPVEITGLGGVPEAGEPFFAVSDERDAKRISQNVVDQRRKEQMAARAKEGSVSLEDLSAMIKEGELKELKVILKGDVQGSVEALREAFSKLGNEEVAVKVIHSAVGGITENDVNLGASSEKGSVVVGFNVRPDSRASEMAEKYGVKILTHTIIYDAIEQIRALLEGMLSPLVEEEVIGRAEVRDIFSAPKIGTIAGCYIINGVVKRGGKCRVLRDSRVIYESTINSLRRFKDDVREVKTGFECGLSVDNFNDIKVGDVVEAYELKEVAATLD